MHPTPVGSVTRRIFCTFSLGVASEICAGPWEPFVGTWLGEHEGKPFICVLVSHIIPPEISVTTADVRASEAGIITEVNGGLRHHEVVLRRELGNGVLHIKAQQDDGDTVDYEMRVDRKGTAALQLLQPAGMKPFQLRRIAK